MLLENPSTYLAFVESTMSEIDFLKEVARRTGCGLLLDVNNVQVSAVNQQTDAVAYLDAFPVEHVGEIHLAGYAPEDDGKGSPLLIDAHDRPIDPLVWGSTSTRLPAPGRCRRWSNGTTTFPNGRSCSPRRGVPMRCSQAARTGEKSLALAG